MSSNLHEQSGWRPDRHLPGRGLFGHRERPGRRWRLAGGTGEDVAMAVIQDVVADAIRRKFPGVVDLAQQLKQPTSTVSSWVAGARRMPDDLLGWLDDLWGDKTWQPKAELVTEIGKASADTGVHVGIPRRPPPGVEHLVRTEPSWMRSMSFEPPGPADHGYPAREIRAEAQTALTRALVLIRNELYDPERNEP